MGNRFTVPSPLSDEQEYFVRSHRAIIGVGSNILQEILKSHIEPQNLHATVERKRLWQKLDQTQRKLISKAGEDGYSNLDITLCYALLRNCCANVDTLSNRLAAPTHGWGKQPLATDDTISDDIERIRLLRNNTFAHTAKTSLSKSDFISVWEEFTEICTRMDKIFHKDFQGKLKDFESSSTTSLEFGKLVKEWKKMEDSARKFEKRIDELEAQVDRHERRLSDHEMQIQDLKGQMTEKTERPPSVVYNQNFLINNTGTINGLNLGREFSSPQLFQQNQENNVDLKASRSLGYNQKEPDVKKE